MAAERDPMTDEFSWFAVNNTEFQSDKTIEKGYNCSVMSIRDSHKLSITTTSSSPYAFVRVVSPNLIQIIETKVILLA